MKSLWNNAEAAQYQDDLALRVYTSRLLGQEPALVLHGGGNTSVKTNVYNLFGEKEELLYVKGSGWDLATIEAAGFAPVKLEVLQKMATLDQLSDSDMVRAQRAAMTNPSAPNPSVEAILHAVIPFKYVDHTHADAVVTITNTDAGEKRIQEIYGTRVLIVPYVMPGFILAKQIYAMTQNIDWTSLEGMILLNHGVFSFSDDAKTSYARMINLVTEAETYLTTLAKTAKISPSPYFSKGGTPKDSKEVPHFDKGGLGEISLNLAQIRKQVSDIRGTPVIASLDSTSAAVNFVKRADVKTIATRGPLTPDHVIRTKPTPVILGDKPETDIANFVKAYNDYFARHSNGQLTRLNQAPCWGIWPGVGIVSFGRNRNEAQIVSDIKDHTIEAIQIAEDVLGGWQVLAEQDLFDMEYWELEQAKLAKKGTSPVLQGQIALVTGAASGIGRACVEVLQAQGAAVIALDIVPSITTCFKQKEILGLVADVTHEIALQQAIATGIHQFGGLDIVISNAGIFPPSETIAEMNPSTWEQSMALNLTSHQRLLQACIPYLKQGINPSVIMMASKNVPAPGPGASAYSVAKAGQTQLARVAALELAQFGIRVNMLHPNAVFDTGIWTPEVLEKRAKHYGLTVAEYKTNNLLKTEITSKNVAELACAMAGPLFAKTTGAQVPIDGGNERVI
jgi:rhamnose utilization protein RhaD (predicted bifunctional aldolase and dehydrogenase)/NAD(P)-dependent dehydrogenase (short-subunit alcohol dehydrogenase family)